MENKFQLTFNEDFNQGSVLEGAQYKVISDVEHIYGKWWHRILYYLTFKQRFIEGYKYNIEIAPKNSR